MVSLIHVRSFDSLAFLGAMTLIQSAPIKNRIPSATLSVNELIKLDLAMMVHKILNE